MAQEQQQEKKRKRSRKDSTVYTPAKANKLPAFGSFWTHSNPLSDRDYGYPVHPDAKDWSGYYPAFFSSITGDAPRPQIKFADIGCGFGGLLFSLSPLFPDKLMLGMEIRDRVVDFVREKIIDHRKKHPGQFENIAVENINAMKYLPNYFHKGQLEKMFFLFPDPHFKKGNHRRRIINTILLAEYAYVLAVGGIAYTATDVQELHEWMVQHFTDHPLFERITDEELKGDPVIPMVLGGTEEGKKVEKSRGEKYLAVFRRVADR